MKQFAAEYATFWTRFAAKAFAVPRPCSTSAALAVVPSNSCEHIYALTPLNIIIRLGYKHAYFGNY
jgi:hypothetical protein